MTEKRFTFEYDEYNGNLFDNEFNTFYHIEDSEENIELFCMRLNELAEENEHYKSIFFDIVENALEDKNCRELYCKGILSLFDDANSLNQAKEMIKERLK